MLKKCEFVLNNLRDEDLVELKALWQGDWKNKVLNSLSETKVLFAYGYDEFYDVIPIAMGGFYELFDDKLKIACVWLLTTKYVNQNKMALMKELKNQISLADKKYDLMYNFIYKSNFEAKSWLKKFGFSFDNPNPEGLKIKENFEFFYKLTNRKEE